MRHTVQQHGNVYDDDRAAGGFVLWIMAYAILMISLFALRDAGPALGSLVLPGFHG